MAAEACPQLPPGQEAQPQGRGAATCAAAEVEAAPAPWRQAGNEDQAAAAGLVWVKCVGYPSWPAQVVPTAVAESWVDRVPRPRGVPSEDLTLVQFFGTSEFGWVEAEAMEGWKDGLRSGKDRPPRLRAALCQAAGLAACLSAWPPGWWSLPAGQAPNPMLPPPCLKRKRPGPQPSAVATAAPAGGPQYVKLRRNEWAPGLKQPKARPLEDSCVCQCAPPASLHAGDPAVPKGKEGASLRTGCGRGCLNRSMNTFCDPRTCPCKQLCSNGPFHRLPMPRTRAFQTPDGRGWGLAAGEAIQGGTFVVEYMGEILDDVMCEQRLWADKARGETNFYMMEVARNQVIDARLKGNTSRLINSSCRPNCETQRWVDGATGETRVGIFALRTIQEGEELTYDYCFTHFGDDDATSFRCMCGAPDCRGTLDANPQRGLNRGRRIEVLWDDGQFYPATVASFNASTSKYRLVYDDGDVEVLRLEADPAKRKPDDAVFRWLPQDDIAKPQDAAADAALPAAAEDHAAPAAILDAPADALADDDVDIDVEPEPPATMEAYAGQVE